MYFAYTNAPTFPATEANERNRRGRRRGTRLAEYQSFSHDLLLVLLLARGRHVKTCPPGVKDVSCLRVLPKNLYGAGSLSRGDGASSDSCIRARDGKLLQVPGLDLHPAHPLRRRRCHRSARYTEAAREHQDRIKHQVNGPDHHGVVQAGLRLAHAPATTTKAKNTRTADPNTVSEF